MSQQKKSIQQINRKLAAGEAKVMTQFELFAALKDGAVISAAELDVVTVAFRSSMASSAAMMLVPVADRGVFTRAKRIWLNGVEGFPGPAPNERLGVVDTLVYAEQASRDESIYYTGAHILLDLLGGKDIEVECISEEGGIYFNSFKLPDLQFARMYTYNSFIPTSKSNLPDAEATGNEHWDNLHIGDKMLLNNAEGIIVGSGTRSTKQNRSLSLAADLFTMDLRMLTNGEKDDDYTLSNTIAIPIPILNNLTMKSITNSILNEDREGRDEDIRQHEREISGLLKDKILTMQFKLADSAMEIGSGY